VSEEMTKQVKEKAEDELIYKEAGETHFEMQTSQEKE